MDNDPALFWEIDNIAFAHFKCNVGAANRHSPAKLATYEKLRQRNTLPLVKLSAASVKRYERMERQGKAIPVTRPIVNLGAVR